VSDFACQLAELRARHHVTGISYGDPCRSIVVLQDDVARQRQAGSGVDDDRPMRESRIACTEDLQWGSIDPELLLERGRDVDLGQDTEALPLQRGPDLYLGQFHRYGKYDFERVHVVTPSPLALGGGSESAEHQRGGARAKGDEQPLVHPYERREQQEPRTHHGGEYRTEENHRSCHGEQDPLKRPADLGRRRCS